MKGRSIVGLKIKSFDNLTKCIKIVRKYNSLPMSELVSKIENQDYVLVYDYTDDVGVKNIIKCYYELTNENIIVEIFALNHIKTSIEQIMNLDNMYDEIEKEVENDED